MLDRRALSVLLLAVLLGVTALVAPVAAQDGVVIDPDSPAGKEYALPIEQARRDASAGKPTGAGAAGVTSQAGSATRTGGTPLFGTGISNARYRQKGANRQGDPGRDGSSPGRGNTTSGSAAGPSSGSGVAQGSVSGSTRLWILVAGGAVLVLGAAAGLGMRRIDRRVA